MPPAGNLLLVAEDALEGAGKLRDEDGDGIVLWVHLMLRVTGFGLRVFRYVKYVINLMKSRNF